MSTVRRRWTVVLALLVTAMLPVALWTGCGSAARPDLGDQGAGLHAAARSGDVASLRRLLDDGAPVDAINSDGETPLLVAVRADRTPAAELLLERGADVNAQASNLDTPWLLAGAEGRADILELMLGHRPDLSIHNRFGGTALIPACERGHVAAVRVLVRSGIDVDHVNRMGWTCLLELVILGDGGPRHQEVARRVLDAGADPNIPDATGVTPLAHATSRGHHALARLIAGAGGR